MDNPGKSAAASTAANVSPLPPISHPPTHPHLHVYILIRTHPAVGVETSHSVGITWEKGGELGIGGGDLVTLAAGASFSVAEQVTDATAESGDKLCPEGPWHCSAVFYPWGVKMSGHFHKLSPTESCDTAALGAWTHDVEEGTPWEAWAPKKDASGNGFGTLEICTCENMEHWVSLGGWKEFESGANDGVG